MEIFTAASHQNVLALITQIAALLFMARTLGEIAQRLGQPSVVGEISAGILLGPSFLGKIFPAIQGIIIPNTPTQGYLLEAISLLGAIFLLLMTGLETDIGLIRRHSRTALSVSLGGLTLTFASGFILGQCLPDYLLTESSERMVFSLFIATAMSISAIPVISKVLIEMKIIRRDISQTIIASGMTDDTIGWILLSIIAGLASGKAITPGSVFVSVGSVIAFMILSFTVGRWLVKKSLDFVQDNVRSSDKFLTLIMVYTFLWGTLTHLLHLEPILGAFVMGILFGQMPRFPHEVREKISSLAMGIFSPIFFAVAGLKVNILYLFKPEIIWIAFLVVLIATIGKLTGTFLGARLLGKKDFWSSLSFGAALNARGAMEIIVATIGLSLGVLTREMFSIIVVMAVTTSLMAPTALRWVLRHVKPTEEEEKRLKKEALTENSPIMGIHRILVPLRQGSLFKSIHSIKISILESLTTGDPLSITFLQVINRNRDEKNAAEKFSEELDLPENLKKHEVLRKIQENRNVTRTILNEARKEYDLLILGASRPASDKDNVFSSTIDTLLRFSPCSTLVVHIPNPPPIHWSLKKILVPTNGSMAAKHAAELAFLMAAQSNIHVIILHVVAKDPSHVHQVHETVFERQLKMSHRMIDSLKTLGDAHNVSTSVEVRISPAADTEILHVARQEEVDLIIIGTEVRVASDKLFLGPRIERILKSAPCPVAVLNTL